MSMFLEQMRQSSVTRLEAAKQVAPLEAQRRRAEMRPTIELPEGFLVFAEIKPVSPAEGRLETSGLADRVRSYQAGGAAAISVLTEPTEFGGSLELLEELAGEVSVPVMRKDFIVDPYQVWEARAHGASGVLALVRMLDVPNLQDLIEAAGDAELFILLEVFDSEELEIVADLDFGEATTLLGVNSRDLTTLEVRPDAHEKASSLLPEGLTAIAESGISGPGRVAELREMGYAGVLVGTSLMRSDDPEARVASIVAAGADPE